MMKHTKPVRVSIYGGHNASVSYQISSDGGKTRTIKTIELERLRQQRHYMLFDKDNDTFLHDLKDVTAIAKEHWGVSADDVSNVVLYGVNGNTHQPLLEKLGCEIISVDHHKAHAACSFGQSGFDEAIVVSIDGGGNDGVFNVYHATKAFGGKLTLLDKSSINLGHSYMLTGYPISEIKGKKGGLPHDLSIAGKLMGLAAYGRFSAHYQEVLREFYTDQTWNVQKMLKSMGLPAQSSINTLSGQSSFDLAANSQRVLEDMFWSVFVEGIYRKLPAKYRSIPLCLSGGVALNVLLNQMLIDSTLDVPIFIPPNPDDSGLSMGQLFYDDMITPLSEDLTFNGMPWMIDNLDSDKSLPQTIYRVDNCSVNDLVNRIVKDGAIVGVIDPRGSEIGPRALGHRSIVCLPSIPGMKDTLNQKVKFREPYRPFAPFCLTQNAPGYFVVDPNKSDSFRFMSHAPTVRIDYREPLAAITHQDKSSRLQTVNPEHKGTEIFAAMLGSLKTNHHGVPPVLLNTSFNIKGKPILTTLRDALNVLETTELDYVFVGSSSDNYNTGTLYGKRNR